LEFRHERLVETGLEGTLDLALMRIGSDFNGNPATMHERWGLGCNQWEVVLRMRDRYPLVTNPGAHPLTYQFSKLSNSLFWYITIVLQKKLKSRN
jgi:hypothetical protein